MKNLKILVIVLMCVGMFAACEEGNKYTILGTTPAEISNDEIVYLVDLDQEQAIDSATVVNGKFSFEGVVDEAKAVMLVIQNLRANIILEKGKIKVDMSESLSAKGAPLTDQLNAYFSECVGLIEQVREKMSDIDESLLETDKGALRTKMWEDYQAQMDEISQKHLKKHPNDILGAMVFLVWMQSKQALSSDEFTELSKPMGENVLNFGPVKKMVDLYEKQSRTEVGKPFVDFTIANGNLDGTPASLSDYVGKGKYVLVDFWASWCQPCRMEAPVIAEVYKKYKGDKFEVLGIAVWDQRENTEAAIQEDGYVWPQIIDAQTIPTDLYGIRGIPHIILFGPDGTILDRALRGDGLKAKIAEVMQ